MSKAWELRPDDPFGVPVCQALGLDPNKVTEIDVFPGKAIVRTIEFIELTDEQQEAIIEIRAQRRNHLWATAEHLLTVEERESRKEGG